MSLDYGILLVVTNDDAIYQQVRDRLEPYGYTVIGANEGQLALAMAQSQNYDLVLLALDLPDMECAQFIQALKAEAGPDALPVLVMAAHADVARIDTCITLGAADYVDPFGSTVVLRARIMAHLERTRLCNSHLNSREKEILLIKIERDLQIGHTIQASFLPKELPGCSGWKIAHTYKPAREVGGDLYDVFAMTQSGLVGFIIGDVCDKGVGAALFMALFRSFFRAVTQQRYLLSTVFHTSDLPETIAFDVIGTNVLKRAFELVNNYVIDNHGEQGYFATLFFGVLEPATGNLLYVNGGHVPALLISEQGVKERLTSTGPAVGLMSHAVFGVEQVRIEPGDILFAYTDGVTDARDPGRQFFSEPRLVALAEQPVGSANDLVERVHTNLMDHIAGAEQYDDITMLVMQRVIPAAAG
jgi:two-component system response regulator